MLNNIYYNAINIKRKSLTYILDNVIMVMISNVTDDGATIQWNSLPGNML